MRKSLIVFAWMFCGFCIASQPVSGASICDGISPNLVTNCGFETGDFTNWVLAGNTLNPGSNYYGADAFDANSGSLGAYMSQDLIDGGTSAVTLTQTLATSAGAVYSVSFWLEQDTTPAVGYNHLFSATWGGTTTMLSLAPTVAAPGTVGPFTQYSFLETATGTSTALAFTFENDDSFWSFDDVSVSQAPETSTGLLGGLALGIVLMIAAADGRRPRRDCHSSPS